MKKLHLVFSRRIPGLEAELCRDFSIHSWTASLADTCLWAQAQMDTLNLDSSENPAPDIILVNGADHYRRQWKVRQNPDQFLLKYLLEISQLIPSSRLKLLLPVSKNMNQELLIELMQYGLYDFWFLDKLDGVELKGILEMDRNFAELEQYLKILPMPVPQADGGKTAPQDWRSKLKQVNRIWDMKQWKRLQQMDWIKFKNHIWHKLLPVTDPSPFLAEDFSPAAMGSNQIEAASWLPEASGSGKSEVGLPPTEPQGVKPQAAQPQPPGRGQLFQENPMFPGDQIHGGTVLFWSQDDCLQIYGVAFLLAYHLAAAGYKTVLVELPSHNPRLGAALGLRHPRWNLRWALERFGSGQNQAFQQCLFNGAEYLESGEAWDPHPSLAYYPEKLYFLPDGDVGVWDQTQWAALQPNWERFLILWLPWVMFQQKIQFIFFVGFGASSFQKTILEQMSHFRVFVLQPWAPSYNWAEQVRMRWPESSLFLWGSGAANLSEETQKMKGGQSLRLPASLSQDFLAATSFHQRPQQMAEETKKILEEIGNNFLSGFKLPRQCPTKRNWLTAAWLKKRGV